MMDNLLIEMDEATLERYEEDEAFRRSYGPSVAAYYDFESDYCLLGIQMDLNFGSYGICHGTIREMKESYHNDDSVFMSVWTCEGDDREFKMEMSGNQILSYLFLSNKNLERPSWFDAKAKDGKHAVPYLSLPEGGKLVDFELPCEVEDAFPSLYNREEEEKSERWMVTFWRLNDPDAAAMIAQGIRSYPTPLVLTMMMLVKDGDESTKLPTIVTEENKQVFKLADSFSRKLSGTEGKQLKQLEQLVAKVSRDASAHNNWRAAYNQVQALILTMSNSFEGEKDGWTYADDSERLDAVTASIIKVVGSILLHPPSEDAKAAVEKDMEFLQGHLKEGSFVQIIDGDGFEEEHAEAFKIWKDLVGEDD